MSFFEHLDQWMRENPPDDNPLVRRFGRGPEDAKCKACSHLKVNVMRSGKRHYKCEIRGITNGAGTDHRIKWNACARFAKGEL